MDNLSVSAAGPCEWCGGPQKWTLIRDEVYVACEEGCLPLPLDGLVPPIDSEELEFPLQRLVVEPSPSFGVSPPEGGDTEVRYHDDLPF